MRGFEALIASIRLIGRMKLVYLEIVARRGLECTVCAAAALLVAVSVFASNACVAQTPSAAQANAASSAAPAFDVAAIHPHTPAPHERSHIVDSNGRFTTVNVDLKTIIQWAYDLPQSRIVGGPSWLGSARWDIEAKTDSALDMQKDYDHTAAWEQKRQMVQALLAERFHLAVHRETRELPIYNLVVAKDGPKFTPIKADGTTINSSHGHIQIEGGANTVDVLAEQLAEVLGRVVVNTSGITGRYKVELTWTPDDRAAPPSSDDPANSGPSIFTALQEQLGLKLESAKGPVQVLVIDNAQMASAN